MSWIHLDRKDPTVDRIIRAAFPEHKGRSVVCTVATSFKCWGTNWDSGNKRDYVVVKLDTMEARTVPEAPWLEPSPMHDHQIELPPGIVVVVDVTGRWSHLEIIARNENITPMLPPPDTLPMCEKIVLMATAAYKSSYAGISNYRYHEAHERTGITLADWNAAKESLINKKLLTKAGAITVDGRNSIGNDRL